MDPNEGESNFCRESFNIPIMYELASGEYIYSEQLW